MSQNKTMYLTAGALMLVSTAFATPAGSQAPGAPGVPPSQHGWEYDLEVANRLLDNGYLDAAEKDYTKILTAYSDGVPGIDLAWLGLAKVHQARGETPKARASLQEVLSRDTVANASSEARERYRSLRAEAEMQLNESQRAVFYFEARYRQTTWMNPFGKFFHWMDYRKAKRSHSKMIEDMEDFDPRYLIEPVAKPSAHASIDSPSSEGAGGKPSLDAGDTGIDVDGALNGDYRLTADQMAALLNANGGTTSTDTGVESGTTETIGTEVGESPATEAAPEETTPPEVLASQAPTLDVNAVQQEYFGAFQALRTALSSGDPAKIQEATDAYKLAKETFEAAKTQGMAN